MVQLCSAVSLALRAYEGDELCVRVCACVCVRACVCVMAYCHAVQNVHGCGGVSCGRSVEQCRGGEEWTHSPLQRAVDQRTGALRIVQ
jgi:hypothetical protein